jgi:hypothetical protein
MDKRDQGTGMTTASLTLALSIAAINEEKKKHI